MWLAAREVDYQRKFDSQIPRRVNTRLKPPFEQLAVMPKFFTCLQCGLERLGILHEVTGGRRNRLYRADEILKAIEGPLPDAA